MDDVDSLNTLVSLQDSKASEASETLVLFSPSAWSSGVAET